MGGTMSKCRCIKTTTPMVCSRCGGLDEMDNDLLDMQARAERAESSLARMREYMQHKPGCEKLMRWHDTTAICTCGLAAALAEAPPTEEKS